MKRTEDDMMRLFREMLQRGLITRGSLWIEMAVEQKNSNLPIAVANSMLLTYDRIDRQILTLSNFN
jgi:hypothetical protein